MTISRATWVKNVGTVGVTAADARRAQGGLLFEQIAGVVRSGLVSTVPGFQLVQGTSGLNYNVVAFPAFVIGRAANEGAYILSGQGTTPTANVPAAPSTGLSRWDLIYLKQNDPDKSDPNNDPVLGVAVGQPAASPVKPQASVPAGAVVIAEARIYAGTTGTNQAPNTITQRWRYTAMKGVPIPVRNISERDELNDSPQNTQVRRLEFPVQNQIETWDGTRWLGQIRHAEFSGPVVNSGPNGVNFGNMKAETGKTWNNTFCEPNPASGIRLLEDGLYLLHLIGLPIESPPQTHLWAIRQPADASGNETLVTTNHQSYGSPAVTGTAQFYGKVGDIVTAGITTSTAAQVGSGLKLTKIF